MDRNQLFYMLLEDLHKHTERKHTLHYQAGFGALIIPEGYPLKKEFVIIAISESQIQMHLFMGNKFNINF